MYLNVIYFTYDCVFIGMMLILVILFINSECADSRRTSDRDPLISSSRKASGDESDASRNSGSP